MVVRKRERFPLARRVAAVGSLKKPSPEYPATTRKRRQQPFVVGNVRPGSRLAVRENVHLRSDPRARMVEAARA